MKEKKLNILFLTSTFFPTIGGAETYAFEICRGLCQKGHNVYIFTDQPRKSNDINEIENIANMYIYRAQEYHNIISAKDNVRWEQMGISNFCSCLLVVMG